MIKYKNDKIVNFENYRHIWMTNPPQEFYVEIPILEKDILEGHSIWFYRKICQSTFKVTENIIKKLINFVPSEREKDVYIYVMYTMKPTTVDEYLDIWESQANSEFIANYKSCQ